MAVELIPPGNRLDAALKDNGIPIGGVSGPNASPPNFTVSYAPEATAPQIAAGDLLAYDFDVRYYRRKDLAVIASELTALNASGQQIIRDACAAFVVASIDRADALIRTMLQPGFGLTVGAGNVLKIGTAASLIRADPRFAVRLGVDVPGDTPVE